MSSNVAGSFVPAWWVPGAHLQTLWGKLVRRPREIPTRVERWATPDGDEIEIRRLAPRPDSSSTVPRLLLLHGLEGTIRSHYLRGMLARAQELGWAADILIFRGCNGTVPRGPRLYHSGETTDLDMVVHRLVREDPERPLVLAGFSLGGNVLLKWLGERGTHLPAQLQAAAAVSAPFDLELGARSIERGFSRIYTWHFLRSLRRKALAKLSRDPDLFDIEQLLDARTLFDFDDAVTAPVHGFDDATDYYTRSSARQFLDAIRLPTLLLSAFDDPFLPAVTLVDVALMAHKNSFLRVEFSRGGGHVGFVGGRVPWRPVYWAERRVLDYLAAHVAGSTFSSLRREDR